MGAINLTSMLESLGLITSNRAWKNKIDMRRFIGLSVVFILCFILDVCIPQSPLRCQTVGFAPFITTLLGRSSRHKTLLLAFLCGIIHDLFTMQHRIGVSASGYVFCTLGCFLLQRRYFEEKAVPFFL